MTDETKPDNAKPDDDAKPKGKGKNIPDDAVRDFAHYDDALAAAVAFGGDADDIAAIGTAFHVSTGE